MLNGVISEPNINFKRNKIKSISFSLWNWNVYTRNEWMNEWVSVLCFYIWFFRFEFRYPIQRVFFSLSMQYNFNIIKSVKCVCECVFVSMWMWMYLFIRLLACSCSHLVHFVRLSIVVKYLTHSYCQMLVAVLVGTNFDCSKLGFEVLPMAHQMVVVHQDSI